MGKFEEEYRNRPSDIKLFDTHISDISKEYTEAKEKAEQKERELKEATDPIDTIATSLETAILKKHVPDHDSERRPSQTP